MSTKKKKDFSPAQGKQLVARVEAMAKKLGNMGDAMAKVGVNPAKYYYWKDKLNGKSTPAAPKVIHYNTEKVVKQRQARTKQVQGEGVFYFPDADTAARFYKNLKG